MGLLYAMLKCGLYKAMDRYDLNGDMNRQTLMESSN